MPRLDLTPFGFTPTESLVYEVLLTEGPGTGYGIARSAGLARANAYSALEGLVTKGAARMEGGRPKRYRPEPPSALLARIAGDHGRHLDRLTAELEAVAVPATPTLVEVTSSRGALQLIQHDVARATSSVRLLAPAEAFPLLGPALRRPASAGVTLALYSVGPAQLGFAPITTVTDTDGWPGAPLICVTDDRTALIASRQGAEVAGHWSTSPTFVAAAGLAIRGLTVSS
ncbi:MAG TPA: helix-turn-helix domain-containing protein [Gemmatimonadales bacterium]|nr:helix-turn-helix domain-containing protein [Gemmatimonadales bacterium]